MSKKVYTIKNHVPGFISGVEIKKQKFTNLNELLEIDFVKRWLKHDFFKLHYSGNCLMVHGLDPKENNLTWWVIGYFVNDEIAKEFCEANNIPQWVCPQDIVDERNKERQQNNAKIDNRNTAFNKFAAQIIDNALKDIAKKLNDEVNKR